MNSSRVKIIRITTVPTSLRGLLNGQLKFMSQYFEVVAISSPGEALEDVNNYEGVKTYAVPIKRKPSPIADVISVVRLYHIFRKEKPTIVHTHTPKAGLVGIIAAFLAKVPIRLHTVAGLPLMTRENFYKKILITIEKIIYSFSTKVYSNSQGLKDYILSLGIIRPSKLEVIANGSSNGIDLDYFDPYLVSVEDSDRLKKDYRIKDSDIVFIYIGRIVKDKGVNELVQSFRNLTQRCANLKLFVVGKFEDSLDPIDRYLKEYMRNSSDIILTGYQTDIRPFLKLADIFVHPSYREGFPNVVMQACAFNKPSIVTDINGSNEIIENGVNGIIVPAKNLDALESSMKLLIENKSIRDKYSFNGRQMMIEKFARPFVWGQIYQEYTNLLRRKYYNFK